MIKAQRLRAGDGHRIGAPERVTVVLDQPKVVFAAELQHGSHVEGIAQRVGDHDGLGLAGHEGGVQLLGAEVAGDRIVVEEHGNRAELQNGRNGGGKAGRHRDDFIARLEAFV